MLRNLCLLLFCLLPDASQAQAETTADELPTVYEYFTAGGIHSALTTLPDTFQLNGRNITIFSGAIHYFRVHPGLWRDRLRKLRAAGFNAVETYIPWNLHEPQMDRYDFGDGDEDFSPFLNVTRYVQIAQEEDLLVVIRSGPFIAAEWDYGGLPAWLLRKRDLQIRTWDPFYIERMRKYFNVLFPKLAGLQFEKGGAIIAFQIENEYAYVSAKNYTYLEEIKRLMDSNGISALKFTTDTPTVCGRCGGLEGVMMTANFGSGYQTQLNKLKSLQPDKPCWVMEFWTGWFDQWFEAHHTRTTADYLETLEGILKFPSSVNLYMFHGGTNFGFMNGATTKSSYPTLATMVTSYDYDAPLSEAGDYTSKYNATIAVIQKYDPVKTRRPEMPRQSVKERYPDTAISGLLTLDQLVAQVDSSLWVRSKEVMALELLDINNGSGQTGGFAVYRRSGLVVPASPVLKIQGRVHDLAVVMVDGVRKTAPLTSREQTKGFGYWESSDQELRLDSSSAGGNRTLDILVEGLGHGGRKGLYDGPVLLSGAAIQDWEIIPLEFKRSWASKLQGWLPAGTGAPGPALHRAILEVAGQPRDTFLDMTSWGKGVVLVNSFNVGRYFSAGPQRTCYVPAPLLRAGRNEILIFELYTPQKTIRFSDVPKL
ncbi:beta-galactosidase-1-like protein 3 isoform X1 [Bacillus rossius redtenbacheri]|uniref:beta-galactosidase-1-like protein 3 isoform X1 n=2 Tax=Bacillus rossius redtenbacheri TaxID=93214 RepID=UPI002FDCA155